MLQVIGVSQAQELSRSIAGGMTRTELLPLSELVGRVCAQAPLCGGDIPAFRRSTMDGFAVIAADTFGAGEASPAELRIAGEIRMGEETKISLTRGTCAAIPTGGMMPENADAVIPVEYTETDGCGSCLVYRPVSPYGNVMRAGEDVRGGGALFPRGKRLTPAAVGVLAAAGADRCLVYEKPRVGILSTGNEVVPVTQPLSPGKVHDVNTHLLEALCGIFGCETRLYGIVPDNEDALTGALRSAAEENDLVLLSGGSSAGEKDLTARVIASLGEVLAHGIAMKPGKPTVIGRIREKPVFGLPGNPAACFFVTEIVVRPCIEALVGASLPRRETAAVLAGNLSSNHGREEFVCVSLSDDGSAYPIAGKSGVISLLNAADGYLHIPRDCEGLPAGSAVRVILF
ncbi:MAG: molybdopterin molybdenumtransferase MoeA [Clostridia bacterium]|nr:molybdopterin molybdenumtransferase MoeA [Clostridia bacterium]